VTLNVQAELEAAQRDPLMVEAALALQQGKLDAAESALRNRLRDRPTDIAAIRMLAEVAARIGRYPDAEKLLARALVLAPDFHAARANYVTILQRQSKFVAAEAEADRLIAAEPNELGHLALRAAVLVRTGDQPWSCVEDGRAARREHCRLSPCDRAAGYAWGRVVERRQFENRDVRGR